MPPPGGAGATPTRLGSWPMQFVLSADRLFGIHGWSSTLKPPVGNDVEASGTGIYLLWGSSNTGTEEFATNPFAIPRLSADLFVIPGLSVGLSFGYTATSGEADDPYSGTTEDFDELSAFAVQPRIGYAAMFSDQVGLWPRVGITYVGITSTDVENDIDTDYSFLDVDGELMLVLSPAPHFAFTVGPVVDLGLSGSYKPGDTESLDATVTNIGVVGGMLGYF